MDSVKRLAAVLALLLSTSCPAALLADDAAQARVSKLVQLLDGRDGDQYWSVVTRLEGLGKEAVPTLVTYLSTSSEKARLGCAKALLSVGGADARTQALEALSELSTKARAVAIRIDAVQLYGFTANDDELDDVIEVLEGRLDTETNPGVLIAVARTLWELDNVPAARDKLLSLLNSQEPAVRQEAALTLAEGGQYSNGIVKDILRRLKNEPTPRGRRAELLYRLMRLETQLDEKIYDGKFVPKGTNSDSLLAKKEARIQELEKLVDELERRPAGPPPPGTGAKRDSEEDRLLEEVIARLQNLYVNEDKTSRDKLLLAAIKGMVGSLDDHTLFMEAEQSKDFDQDIRGEYPGIGAHISKRPNGPLEILRPIYGGPAHKAGLRSGDLITEITGRPTPELKLDQLKDLLRGPRGTTVELKVLRRGWNAPRPFELARDRIELSSVFYEILPESIGYLRLTQFGSRSAHEFREALDKLEADGMKGLLIDLRNNPGGALQAAERIADLFVAGDLPIVTQKGRDGSGEKETLPDPQARQGYPIVVLVNQYSASASEIVSGCLQDYRRATLVGVRTFGKGSVQRLVPVETRKGCMLKVTVQYWYLPLGRCINAIRDDRGRVLERGGVVPDVEVTQPILDGWRIDERAKLRTNDKILAYVETHLGKLRGLVPLGDQGDESNYPGFGKLYESLETRALRDDVRQVVRYQVRRKLEDERGREFAYDLQEDVQLQRGVLELLKSMGRAPDGEATYRWIAAEAVKASAAPESDKETTDASE